MSLRAGIVGFAVVLLVVWGGAVGAAPPGVADAQPPRPQEEFVPVDQLPQAEALPAAPLLVAAYAFAWVALVGYLWSVWRRLGKIERELAEVARRLAASARRE
jgi:CcmD family protein